MATIPMPSIPFITEKSVTNSEQIAYMYVLECSDGTLYTGYTTNLDKRIATHNSGKGAKYTRTRRPVRLLYHETFPDKKSAMRAESLFKQKKRQDKLTYIKKHQTD